MAGRSHAMLHLNYPEGLRGTSLEAKVVYTRLLSDDALNHAGVLPLRIALWADDCEMPEGDIDKALRELEDNRYAYTDYKTHQVLVRTLIRKDGIADMPNVLWSACKEALRLRSRKLRRVLAAELRKLAPKPPDKINEKTGKRYVYPDPHATADAIDPGPPDDSERDPGTLSRTLPNPSEPLPRDAGTPGGGGGGGGKSPVGENSTMEFFSSDSADAEPDAPPPPRQDVEELCTRLRDRIIGNDFKPTPNITKTWRRDAAHLLDLDGRDHTQALRLIDWAHSSSFWAPNIRSMATFRKQYDQLLNQARQEQTQRSRTRTTRTTDDKRAAIPGLIAEVLGATRPDLRAISGGQS